MHNIISYVCCYTTLFDILDRNSLWKIFQIEGGFKIRLIAFLLLFGFCCSIVVFVVELLVLFSLD